MLNAIFAIKPKYVEKIFSGEKRFEFRSTVCKQQINKMVIYETSPVSKIVGEVSVSKVLKDTPENIWLKTKEYAGIDYDSFMNYFRDRKFAFAYVEVIVNGQLPEIIENIIVDEPVIEPRIEVIENQQLYKITEDTVVQ